MQLTSLCVPWVFALFIRAFSSAVGYVIRNDEAMAGFEKPNVLQSEYQHEPQMVQNKGQNKLILMVSENDDKHDRIDINVHTGNIPSKVGMSITIIEEETVLMIEAGRQTSKGVRNKRFIYNGGIGMKGSQLARNHRGGDRGGPGGWYGRGPYGGGPWGPPHGGPPPWAWGPPPWAWNSPWAPLPWAWGSPWLWGGQYNQSMPNQWVMNPPVDPTRPTPNLVTCTSCTTKPPIETTSATVSKPAPPTVPNQGISTRPPIMQPSMTTPGISTAPSQGISTTPNTTSRPAPQEMTTRRPFTTISGQGMTSSDAITATVQSLIIPTTLKQGTPISAPGSIKTQMPGLTTTEMPFKHGTMEPDTVGQSTESSGQSPIAFESPSEKPDDEKNIETPTVETPSPNEQSSMEHSPTMGPVSQSDNGLGDPAQLMDLEGQNGQTTIGPGTSMGSSGQNGHDLTTEATINGPETQIGVVHTENGSDSVNPSPSAENNDKGKDSSVDISKTGDQGAQILIEQRPGPNDQLQQGLGDPVPEAQPDTQNEQGLDSRTPSDHEGENGSLVQDQMNPGPTEGILDQSKDDANGQRGTDDQGVQVPANPGPTSGSKEQIQQDSVYPVPEIIPDGESEKAAEVPNVDEIEKNGSLGHNQVDSSQKTESTGGQIKDGSQALVQSEIDNQETADPLDPSPTRGPDPSHHIGPEAQRPVGSLDSHGNSTGSQTDQASEVHSLDQIQQEGSPDQVVSNPAIGTDDQSMQGPHQEPDPKGTDKQSSQPSTATVQPIGSTDINNTPSSQIQPIDSPGQSPSLTQSEESQQTPEEPGQADSDDKGAQGFTDPSTAGEASEHIPQGSMESAQEIRQGEDAPDIPSASSDQRQQLAPSEQVDSSPTQRGW